MYYGMSRVKKQLSGKRSIMLKCFFLRLILQFINLILFVYQKYTLILVLLLMIVIWKFLGTPQLTPQATLLTKKRGCLYLLQKLFTFINYQCPRIINFYLSLSPSQSQDDFETFTENLELNLENLMQRNPFLVVSIRDFNTKSSNFEGDAIENLTSQFGLHQVIKEQTRTYQILLLHVLI